MLVVVEFFEISLRVFAEAFLVAAAAVVAAVVVAVVVVAAAVASVAASVAVVVVAAVASSGPHRPSVENLRPSWGSVWQGHSPTKEDRLGFDSDRRPEIDRRDKYCA